jgi:hypothetical protein
MLSDEEIDYEELDDPLDAAQVIAMVSQAQAFIHAKDNPELHSNLMDIARYVSELESRITSINSMLDKYLLDDPNISPDTENYHYVSQIEDGLWGGE